MGKNVVIIDYQLGNLFSVKQACEHLGYEAVISSNPEDLKNADYAILPGVGAFKDAMENLENLGLKQGIYDFIAEGKPFMGVCLGLQLLLSESEEFGDTKGLGIIPGKVKKFPVQLIEGQTHKVPQIQWNNILAPRSWNGTPLQGCKDGDYVYFVHSFYAQPDDDACVLSKTVYGNMEYCSAVLKNNVFATQFHPEKSGEFGVNIYKEWFQQNQK